MNKSDTQTAGLRPRHSALRGAFTPEQVRRRFDVAEWEPPADLRPWISHLWRVRWSLPPGETHLGRTLPFPVVHVVFEDDGTANVVGPIPRRFERRLEGDGGVLGVHVRPAMFRAWCHRPLFELQDQRVDADTIFGPAVNAVAAGLPDLDLPDRCEAICAWLRTVVIQPPPSELCALRDAVDAALAGRFASVPELAAALRLSERTLLRRCRDAIGWTPSRIVKRHRAHEALARMDAGARDLGSLAYELGYADQAHFSRDLKLLTGLTPLGYLRELEGRTQDVPR